MALKAGARIISSADAEYPRLLVQTRDDPQILFVKGRLASSPEKSVAIIGTREPTEHGKIIARRLTEFFVEDGWSVVSGLALGWDGIAHEVAVSAGGHTVAVLAHGLQTISPKGHTKLAEQILESGGALVTEYRMGQGPLPAQFVKRDRTQAGLAQGVVMIQSDLKGGSLFASRAAIEYQRWLSVPYPTPQDVSRQEPKVQANILLADGALREKSDLLKCEPGDLERLIVLRSKSDYAQMIHPLALPSPPDQTPLSQLQLF
ncbi:DNA-protecting protein DprA [Mesorhizobium sp. M1050]|uniref:DNA-processing protein DprA n=1 Tax=Mesorhizobium sp. M1050 TaxID=2957051 RepID=UPI0033364024